MRVNIDLSEPVLDKLEKMAKAGKRNRKNFMEYILESTAERGNLVWADEKKDKVVFEPSQDGKFAMHQPPKIKRSFENYRQLKLECESPEEWEKLKAEILAADHLSDKQKNLLTT